MKYILFLKLGVVIGRCLYSNSGKNVFSFILDSRIRWTGSTESFTVLDLNFGSRYNDISGRKDKVPGWETGDGDLL